MTLPSTQSSSPHPGDLGVACSKLTVSETRRLVTSTPAHPWYARGAHGFPPTRCQRNSLTMVPTNPSTTQHNTGLVVKTARALLLSSSVSERAEGQQSALRLVAANVVKNTTCLPFPSRPPTQCAARVRSTCQRPASLLAVSTGQSKHLVQQDLDMRTGSRVTCLTTPLAQPPVPPRWPPPGCLAPKWPG